MRIGLRIVLALAAASPCCKGGAPSSAAAGTPPGDLSPAPDRPPTPVGQTITTVRVQNLGSTALANVPVTFALPFRRGDVPAAHFVVAREAGAGLATQLDWKVSHPDGSLRHGVLTVSIPSLAPSESRTLELVASPTSGAAGAPLSIDALLAAGFSTEVAFDSGSVARFARTSDAWLAGPLAAEWTSVADASAGGRPLSVRFDVRWYGGRRARVAVTVENAWAFEPGPRNVSYQATLRVGGRDAWSSGPIEHYAHARWRRVAWWGDPVEVHVAHDPAYVISTGAVPAYDASIQFGDAPVAALRAEWDRIDTGPMSPGLLEAYMPSTGGRRDIGPLPSWDAMYLLTADARLRPVIEGTADLAGSWPIHYRDRATGLPPTLDERPYMTLLGNAGDAVDPESGRSDAFPECTECETPLTPDSSHQPSLGYLAYLLFGERAHLDELHFWANWDLLESNPYYRDFASGWLDWNQVRGQAWSLRTLGYAAWVTPDDHPLAAYFREKLRLNLARYASEYVRGPRANALGLLHAGYAFGYDVAPGDKRGMAPWMDDFFTWTAGQLVSMGFDDARPLLAYKAAFAVGRITAPGYCWIFAAPYTLVARDGPDAPVYATLADAYRATFDASVRDLPCGGEEMGAALGLEPGEMTGYSTSATGYPSNMQPALAVAAEHGAAGADEAWRIFSTRPVQPDYRDEPQFAIVPVR
jgi:hypothetical protein